MFFDLLDFYGTRCVDVILCLMPCFIIIFLNAFILMTKNSLSLIIEIIISMIKKYRTPSLEAFDKKVENYIGMSINFSFS